jgi:hypothetical protein
MCVTKIGALFIKLRAPYPEFRASGGNRVCVKITEMKYRFNRLVMNFNTTLVTQKDSIAGTVIALRFGQPRNLGSMPGTGKKFFSQSVHTGCGAHPALVFNGYQGPSLGVKRQGREADYLPPSSAEVKNEWS